MMIRRSIIQFALALILTENDDSIISKIPLYIYSWVSGVDNISLKTTQHSFICLCDF